MCLETYCETCEKAFEFDMKDATTTDSGRHSDHHGVVHWAEGEVKCPDCGTVCGWGVSD